MTQKLLTAFELNNLPFNSDKTNVLYNANKDVLKEMFPDKEENEIVWGDVSKFLLTALNTYKFPVKFKSSSALEEVRMEIINEFPLTKVVLKDTVAVCADLETASYLKLKYT
jgi:hypothetical protein